MSNAVLVNRVKAVLAREWKIEPNAIPDDAALNTFPRWDSLGHIGILLALETEFGLKLTAETVQTLTSLPRLVAHLEMLELKQAA
jgi:acyl carrier protein